jgi:hypothetical protein
MKLMYFILLVCLCGVVVVWAEEEEDWDDCPECTGGSSFWAWDQEISDNLEADAYHEWVRGLNDPEEDKITGDCCLKSTRTQTKYGIKTLRRTFGYVT